MASWNKDGVDFETRHETGEIDIHIPRFGWITGERQYSISAYLPGWPSGHSWTVINTDARLGRIRNARIVLKEHFYTEEIEPHESFSNISFCRTLGTFCDYPMNETEYSLEHFEQLFATPHCETMAHFCAKNNALKNVDINAVEREAKNLLDSVARKLALHADLTLDESEVSAARTYSEGINDNINETVSCSWRWRLAYKAQRRGQPTAVIVEASGFGIDASEHQGDDYVNPSSVMAWLADPRDECHSLVWSMGTSLMYFD